MNKFSEYFEIGPVNISTGVRNNLFHPTGPIEINKKVKFFTDVTIGNTFICF